jgi:UDP:flavonoid glycosyltransferase YjiC (YdhE family)
MRVCFSAIPAYGHVFPLVPLATAAAAAGHEVSFVAGAEFDGRLPVRVLPGVPKGMTLRDVEAEAHAEIRDPSDPFAWPKALFGVVMPRHIKPRLLRQWEEHGRPDLVVHEGSNAGAALAAADAGVPAVAFHIGLTPPAFFLGMLHAASGARTTTVIDPRPPTWSGDAPDAFDHLPIRSVAWSEPTAAAPEWLTEPASGPTAYLTLGTVAFGAAAVLRSSVLETAQRCARVLVAAGPDADLGALGELPANVQVERYVDQARVLEHVQVAVHHGGTGTTLGCLAAGVPQVITPQGADQFLNADRLVQLGLGCAVRNDAAAGAVGEAVGRLLSDDELRAAVRSMGDEIAAMPSPAAVVEKLVHRYG